MGGIVLEEQAVLEQYPLVRVCVDMAPGAVGFVLFVWQVIVCSKGGYYEKDEDEQHNVKLRI